MLITETRINLDYYYQYLSGCSFLRKRIVHFAIMIIIIIVIIYILGHLSVFENEFIL